MLLKVIACEIFFREICHAAARSRNLVELDFLTQGYHDIPKRGQEEIQKRIDAVPAGKYDAILIGYGLCSNILAGLVSRHTRLVIPRAHDCITIFLGSRARYQQLFDGHPGTYYYTSGWLECARRRGLSGPLWGGPASVNQASAGVKSQYETWVEKFGEEDAGYLLEELERSVSAYTHGALIQYDFAKNLGLEQQVQEICRNRGWQFQEIPGDLGLLQRWLDGEWAEAEFLVAPPGKIVSPSYNEGVIGCG